MFYALNALSTSSVYIQDANFVIIVSADVQAPKGAWPSTATMLTTQLDIFLFKFLRLSRTVKFKSHQEKITFFKCVTWFHIQYIPWIIHIIVFYMLWSGLFNQHPSWLLYWHWQIYTNHMPKVIFQSLHCTIYSNHPIQTSDMHLFDSGN